MDRRTAVPTHYMSTHNGIRIGSWDHPPTDKRPIYLELRKLIQEFNFVSCVFTDTPQPLPLIFTSFLFNIYR